MMKQQPSQKSRQQANQFLQVFYSYGLNQRSLITKPKLQRILDEQSKKATGNVFKPQMLQQIWEQSEANSRGQAKVSTIASIVQQAQRILNKRVNNLKGKDGYISEKSQQLKILQEELKDLQQYNLDDNATINKKRRQITQLQIKKNQLQQDLKEFSSQKKFIKDVFHYQEPIIEPSINHQKPKVVTQYSKALLLIFHLTNVCLFLQLIASTYRISFFSLICFLQCYFLLFFGYYNDYSVIYLLIQLVISIILDLTWIILSAFTSVFVMGISHTENKAYFIICTILLLIQLLLKGILVITLFQFKQIKNGNKYFFLMGQKIYLNKRSKRVSFKHNQLAQS